MESGEGVFSLLLDGVGSGLGVVSPLSGDGSTGSGAGSGLIGGGTSIGSIEGEIEGEGVGSVVRVGFGVTGVLDGFGRDLGGSAGVGLGAAMAGVGLGVGVRIGSLQPRIWLL